MPDYPSLIELQADIEFEVPISSALIAEFHSRTEDFMNLRVGIDIPIFPNIYNIVLLVDVNEEQDAILTQCKGYYDPEAEELAAGEVPFVQLSRNIEPLPDHVLEKLTAADPRILETGNPEVTSVVDLMDLP